MISGSGSVVRRFPVVFACLSLVAGGCTPHHPQATPAPPQATAPAATPDPREGFTPPANFGHDIASSIPPPLAFAPLFPLVRVDRASRVVEFDGTVAMDCHNPETPLVYLELVCCSPDSREHESLIVTTALPSHIHAAMLLIGLEAGSPGLVDFRGKALQLVPPTGDGVRLEFVWTDPAGIEQVAAPEEWIKSAETERRFGQVPAAESLARPLARAKPNWIFAGSRFVTRRDPETGERREWYDADGTGTIIGLTTFGSETIAWHQVLSPEESLTPAEWIADPARVPVYKTAVKVRIRPAP